MWLPLPPLAEQKRIVTKIEELLPLIDRYEKAWSRLEEFNKQFPDDMQKSILQMAIQGKLVEQRSEEGTGEELYQQIQAEKQKLIKEGKIKKEKPLPEITEDEKPFDIPESWKWTTLGNIIWFIDAGKSPNCEKTRVVGSEWGVITTTSIQTGFFDDEQNKRLPSSFPINTAMQVKQGDILITRAGPTSRTGVACQVKRVRYHLILSDKTLRINMTKTLVDKDFIVMVINSPAIRKAVINLMSGMDRQQVNISQEKYKTLPIPIPPLIEQKRIVAKLNDVLPLCTRIHTYVTRHLPDADAMTDILSARFLYDPKFVVKINGKQLDLSNHKGVVFSNEFKPTPDIRLSMIVIDSEKTAVKSQQHGIAFWISGRLVGQPSWSYGKITFLDGRFKAAKRYTMIIKTDELIDDVLPDWSGFVESDRMNSVYKAVKAEVDAFIKNIMKDHLDEVRHDVIIDVRDELETLSVIGQRNISTFIEKVTDENPVIGESTRSEIEYAKKTGKKVGYLEDPNT